MKLKDCFLLAKIIRTEAKGFLWGKSHNKLHIKLKNLTTKAFGDLAFKSDEDKQKKKEISLKTLSKIENVLRGMAHNAKIKVEISSDFDKLTHTSNFYFKGSHFSMRYFAATLKYSFQSDEDSYSEPDIILEDIIDEKSNTRTIEFI